jgi:hypothetical protein
MTKSKPKTKAKKATRQPAPKRARKLQADKRTLGTIAGLTKIQYTQKEAGVMGVSESTFAAVKTTPARDTWDLGREAGKVSLHRLQWSAAEKSPAMMVWLGKQL